MKQTATNMNMDQYIKMLEEWFGKLPALPANVREILVKIAPWIALIFGVLGVLAGVGALLALLGVTAFVGSMAPMAMAPELGLFAVLGIVSVVLGLVSSVLMLMAYPGLKAHRLAGWRYLFYSEVASLAGALVALNLIGLVVGALIGFYLLFQIKSHYK